MGAKTHFTKAAHGHAQSRAHAHAHGHDRAAEHGTSVLSVFSLLGTGGWQENPAPWSCEKRIGISWEVGCLDALVGENLVC